jgi:hypothetical protein
MFEAGFLLIIAVRDCIDSLKFLIHRSKDPFLSKLIIPNLPLHFIQRILIHPNLARSIDTLNFLI